MNLTTTQQAAVSEAAFVEMRTSQEMLSLLLAEGLRFYFMDRPQLWHRKDEEDKPIPFDENGYAQKILDELMEIHQNSSQS